MRTLLRLDARRAAALLRYPSIAGVLGTLLPLFVVVSGLVVFGRAGVPEVAGAEGGMTLGMLVAGGMAFISYGVLFRTADAAFLSRMGIPGADLFAERSTRLLIAAVGSGALAGLPFLVAGVPPLRPWVIATTVAVVTAGSASVVYAVAAAVTLDAARARAIGAGISQFDPELARAAPLVYAPLLPFLLGAAFGAFAGSAAGFAPSLLLTPLVGVGGLVLGRRIFAPIASRFLPRVSEMEFVPPPEKGGETFRVGRGISALLPRRAAAAWVRDAAVGSRRFPWASRITWPVVLVCFFALARWGRDPSTQAWVQAAVGIALLVQGAAIVGLGLMERGGPRWIDRLAGLSGGDRFLGRWAWGVERALWLIVPVALAWCWWTGRAGAWIWPAVGAITAGAATAASLTNARETT